MKNKVSIITINWNNAEGLRKTIESVVSQAYENIEYIVVDGDSTDGSKQVINEYSEKITKWVSEPNKGIYGNMNRGIELATGEYFLFLNSGDWFVNKDVLTTFFSEYYTEDVLIGASDVSKGGIVIHTTKPSNNVTLSSFYKRTIPHQATFIKKELFKKYGNYSTEYRIHGDYEFWIRTIILNNCSVRAVNVTVSDYNLEGTSSQKKNEEQSKKETSTILNLAIPFRVLEDYQNWESEKNSMETLYWIKSKNYLYKPLNFLFKIALLVNKVKKK